MGGCHSRTSLGTLASHWRYCRDFCNLDFGVTRNRDPVRSAYRNCSLSQQGIADSHLAHWAFLALALIVPRDLVFRIRRRHGSVDRAFFVGRWEWGVHHQNQVKLAALLNGDGTASNDQRGRGRWEYRDNTCIVQWDNGWRDELYQAPHGFVKLAYENGQFRNASTAKKM